ncbi:hypothetical protein HanIR_Chr10g0460521 [Helianthus annuus]|nr:hypothetical protein HanIR_Chr10g0460521 [Helianthus annuus]
MNLKKKGNLLKPYGFCWSSRPNQPSHSVCLFSKPSRSCQNRPNHEPLRKNASFLNILMVIALS